MTLWWVITQWLDPINNLQATEVFGGHQAFPKHFQHPFFFFFLLPLALLSPLRPQWTEIEFKRTKSTPKSTPCSCWQRGTGAGRGSFINSTGESSGDSLPPSQPLHQEGQKTWREYFLWKLVISRRQTTDMKHKTYNHLMPSKCPSFLTLKHCFPVTFQVPYHHSGELICFQTVFSPSLSTCPKGISWIIEVIQGCYSSSCMILFTKYLNYILSYYILFFPRIRSFFPFIRT